MKTTLSAILSIALLTALGFAFAHAVDKEFADDATVEVHAMNTGNHCRSETVIVLVNGEGEYHNVDFCK